MFLSKRGFSHEFCLAILLQMMDAYKKIVYSLIINVTVWMVCPLSSFNFVEKSKLNPSRVTGCSIPN